MAQCREQVPLQFGIILIVSERLEQVEMFKFHISCHDTHSYGANCNTTETT